MLKVIELVVNGSAGIQSQTICLKWMIQETIVLEIRLAKRIEKAVTGQGDQDGLGADQG